MLSKWPYLPLDIKGIDYNLINQAYIQYSKIESFILNIDNIRKQFKYIIKIKSINIDQSNNIQSNDDQSNDVQSNDVQSKDDQSKDDQSKDDQIILDSPDSKLDYERLIPPYTLNCDYATINGCIKKAAFKFNSTSKTYCWFHVSSHINSHVNCT
jgi:hypothetical protein